MLFRPLVTARGFDSMFYPLNLCALQIFFMIMMIIIILLLRSSKLPVLNLLTGLKSGFFAPIQVKLGMADGHQGPVGCAKFHLNRHRGGVGMWPPEYQKIPLFGKESPLGDCLDRF